MNRFVAAADVLDFWFQGDPALWRPDLWFRRDEAFDRKVRDRFALAVAAAQDGVLDGWTATHPGTLALVIVLDQFARNIHRGSHLAFAGDAHARSIAWTALDRGIEVALTPVQRVFMYLPFEHSERPADQDLSVRLFARLPPADWTEGVRDYAERHREAIRRFGRFPQRNAALGRQSRPAELAWLCETGGF